MTLKMNLTFPRESQALQILVLVTFSDSKEYAVLIDSTYPDGTLSSNRHTEMPFDHLTVNFMLFFSAKITKVYIKIHRFILHGYFALVTNEGIHIQYIVSTHSSTRSSCLNHKFVCQPPQINNKIQYNNDSHTFNNLISVCQVVRTRAATLTKKHTTVRLQSNSIQLKHQSSNYIISYFFSSMDD